MNISFPMCIHTNPAFFCLAVIISVTILSTTTNNADAAAFVHPSIPSPCRRPVTSTTRPVTSQIIIRSSPIAMDDSDVLHRIITTRRTINTFEPDLPTNWKEILNKSIAAAISAPNHYRTEPWRFYVPNRETIVKICELNARIVSEGSGGTKAGEAKLKKWLKVPGWIVVTCKKESLNSGSVCDDNGDMYDMNKLDGRAREDYAAVCCAIQNLSLSLHANGLGSKWTTGPVNFDKRFHDIVGLGSDEYVVGTMFFGKPIGTGNDKTKLSVEDVLRMEN